MSDLTRNLERRMRWIRRRPELPPWWPALQVVAGVVLALFVAFRLIAGTPDTTATPGTIPGGTALPVPAGETTTTAAGAVTTEGPVTTPSTESPSGEATVTVDTSSGGQVQLPASAVERASAAAIAQAPGASVSRVILATAYRSGDPLPTQLLFNVEIDPDPGSGAPVQYKAVTLARTSDGWTVT